MPTRLRLAAILIGAIFSIPGTVHAAPQPLWEIGAGVGIVNAPEYRGADQRGTRVLPIPYVIYRGPILKADREGVRAALFDSERVEVNLSANFSPISSGQDNAARRGMSDLRPVVELGPTVDFPLWRDSGDRELSLRLPLRAAFTVESSPRHIGWLFSPNLRYSALAPSGWKFSAQTGPMVGSRAYNAYYYTVSPTQATATRPAFNAGSGYAGWQGTLILSKRFARTWFGSYLRYDNLRGAAFADSPLVRRRDGVTVGVAAAWVFATSSTMVDSSD